MGWNDWMDCNAIEWIVMQFNGLQYNLIDYNVRNELQCNSRDINAKNGLQFYWIDYNAMNGFKFRMNCNDLEWTTTQ